MSKHTVPAWAAAALLLLAARGWPQLVLGQYEDEAPLASWNTLGIASAPSLACGGAGIAAAWDASAAALNPALACALPRFTVSLGASHLSASLMKYSILNTGVLTTTGPLFDRSYGIDFAGLSVRFGKWALAASATLAENFGRPVLKYGEGAGGASIYSIRAAQSGWLRTYDLSVARSLSRRLAAGVGFHFLRGNIERTTTEAFVSDGVLIDDGRSQRLRGLFVNAGLTWAFSARLSAGLIFRAPSVRKASGRSLLKYRVPATGTDVRISSTSEDEYRQPWVVGAGLSWRPAENLRIVSDVRFFGWSSYKAEYFGEPRERDFRDVWTAAAGVEYSGSYRLFGRNVHSPFRIGVAYDPQPMRTPASSYVYVTFGSGLAVGRIRIDVGVAVGREHGSGDGLSARRAVLSLSYDLAGDRP